MRKGQVRVLIVSPFSNDRVALEELLRGEGHQVCSAATCLEGVALAKADQPDIVIADAQLPGLGFCCDLSALAHPQHTILLCTRSMPAAPIPGVVHLMKPIDLPRLYEHVLRAVPLSRVA